jgi:hypothetical protein
LSDAAAQEARRLTRLGWALWLASLVTPGGHGRELGGVWLWRAPQQGLQLLVHAATAPADTAWQAAGIGTALLLGLAANFTLLLPAGRIALLLAATLPWVPWLTDLVLWRGGGLGAAPAPWSLLYFYPWVAGLVLVQVGRLRWRAAHQGVRPVSGLLRR